MKLLKKTDGEQKDVQPLNTNTTPPGCPGCGDDDPGWYEHPRTGRTTCASCHYTPRLVYRKGLEAYLDENDEEILDVEAVE